MSRIPIRVLDDVVGKAFLATDEDFLSSASKPSCGSTATTAMILGDRFYMFNLGDSRTILCRSGEAHLVSQVLLYTSGVNIYMYVFFFFTIPFFA